MDNKIVVEGRHAMIKIAKALGIETALINRMVIDLKPFEPVRVITSQFVDDKNLDEIVNAVIDNKPELVEAK